jgi:hypothetical protein
VDLTIALAVGANDLVLEATTFDSQLGEGEIALVTQHREDDPTQAMGHGDGRRLVTSLCAQSCEVGVERMVGPAGVMGRLTEHRAQFRRPAARSGAAAKAYRAGARSPDVERAHEARGRGPRSVGRDDGPAPSRDRAGDHGVRPASLVAPKGVQVVSRSNGSPSRFRSRIWSRLTDMESVQAT